MIDETTSLADVAGAVAAALREIDHDPVVVGGSAATVHAPEAYRSRDIDMVIIGGIDQPRPLITAMDSIGFRLAPGHFFMHDHSPYTVEFVPSPVAIAGDVISNFAMVATAFGDLRVLHIEDVIADRLNKYVAYEDPEAFEVAVAVARAKRASLERVASFAQRQILPDSYNAALERLRRRLNHQARTLQPYGFTTAFRAKFQSVPDQDQADIVARAIYALLDEERTWIHPSLDGIAARQSPVSSIDGAVALVVLPVHTKRDLSPVDRLLLAARIIEYMRSRLAALPELQEIPDDGIPSIVTSGT